LAAKPRPLMERLNQVQVFRTPPKKIQWLFIFFKKIR
jgi:hypothetical protein